VAAVALLFLVVPSSPAADDPAGAAREMARKTLAFTRGPVSLTFRNFSSLPDSQLGPIRREMESALGTPDATPPTEARVTLSENSSEYLLVEEARRGDESRVWIASWKRAAPANAMAAEAALDNRLVWEQDEPILDVAFSGEWMIVLAPSRIAIYSQQASGWALRRTIVVELSHPLPRDPRGRLRVTGTRVQVLLSGVICSGTLDGEKFACQESSEPWVLDSGGRDLLLASFSASRNYFDGHVVLQNGSRKTGPPFYSAAAVQEASGLSWLLATVDGNTRVFSSSFDSVASIPGWGSDIAGLGTRCGEANPVLVTRPGDTSEPDSVQAFTLANHTPVPVSSPAPLSGPVTALWPLTSTSAVAVSRDLATGKYRAYVLTLRCGP
jgi:hypothetical protein